MQIAGESCSICQQNVMFAVDGTWCCRCATLFHRDCIAIAGDICPKCQQRYAAPEVNLAYSRYCPECMTPNDSPRVDCRECRANTCWDSVEQYQAFVAHMRFTSRWNQVRGVLEIISAFLCVAFFFGAFFLSSGGPILVVPGILLFLAFWLVGDGISRFHQGRAIRHFE